MKRSITYFFGLMASIIWIIFNCYNISFVNRCNYFLANSTIPIKLFANSFIDLPMTLSEYLSQNRHLKAKIKELKMENDKLKIALTTVADLKNELNELKKAVDFKYKMLPYKVIERVLGFDKGMYESFMLISATHDTVKPGNVVISSNGLIGVIYDVKDGVARVMHICDQKINVPVVSQSGDHIILSGNGKDNMFSKEIEPNINTIHLKSKENDLLITSGEGGVFQYGIPVARIQEVKDDIITAQPITRIDDVAFVWILQSVIR